MKTEIIKIDRDILKNNRETYIAAFKKAAIIINRGGLVAFPTETVYGLGALATDKKAAKKIYEAKGRPSDNPLIVHIASKNDLDKYAINIPKLAYKLADRFWPGPLTMILEKDDSIPYETTGGLDTVGLRVPSDEVALEFLKEAKVGVAAPSANISGRPSPTKADHVIEDMYNKIDLIIDASDVDYGLESTIIDLTSNPPLILRPGAISLSMLKEIDSNIEMDKALFINDKINEDLRPKAPGMKYRHYAPKAELSIIEADKDKFISFIDEKLKYKDKKVALLVSEEMKNILLKENKLELSNIFIRVLGKKKDYKKIAHNLFSALRDFDELNVDEIYSESFSGDGMAFAIMNRLTKAAGYNIIKL